VLIPLADYQRETTIILWTSQSMNLLEKLRSSLDQIHVSKQLIGDNKVLWAIFFASLIPIFISLYRYYLIKSKKGKKKIVKIPPKTSTNIGADVFDLIRHDWCRHALADFTDSCCPLFDYIRKMQGNNWGSILDAGTGSHSLEWIIGLNSTKWTAITGDPKRQAAMEKLFEGKIRPEDKVISGNWKDDDLLEGEVYDIVIADYLIGSLDGYAPYYQYQLIERLKPHVGKKLYIVGAEPFPDKVEDDEHGQLIVDIAKIRDSCILLAGQRPYREYPMDWVMKTLKRAGFHINGVGFFESTHGREFVEMQLNVAETKLKYFQNKDLAQSMQKHIDETRSKVRKLKWGIRFGNDYVIAATPIQIKHRENYQPPDEKLELPKNYVSPVQEQKEIFPRDEE